MVSICPVSIPRCYCIGGIGGGGNEQCDVVPSTNTSTSTTAATSTTTTSTHCDVVILATGFKPTHADWLSGVSEFASGGGDGRGGGGLEETAGVSGGGREVYRVGFSHGDALLPLRQIGKEALAVAKSIALQY